MTRYDASAPTTLEATDNVKTCTRGFGTRAHSRDNGNRRERADRVFRDIHGTESQRPTIVRDEQSRPKKRDRRRRRFLGDTGLWFVPTAEVLAHGKWSVTGYRRGTNYIQGYTNVGDFAGTFAVGIKDRAEIFTSFLVDTRIDRDVRPIFIPTNTEIGSFVDRNPLVNQVWTGNNIGDWYIGGKINLLSEFRQNKAAVALRGILKIPTADKDIGNGHGQDRLPRSTSSPARTSRKSRNWPAMPGTNFAARPPASKFPAARSAGALASAFPRAVRCA